MRRHQRNNFILHTPYLAPFDITDLVFIWFIIESDFNMNVSFVGITRLHPSTILIELGKHAVDL